MYLAHNFYFSLDNLGQIICKVEDTFAIVKFKFYLYFCIFLLQGANVGVRIHIYALLYMDYMHLCYCGVFLRNKCADIYIRIVYNYIILAETEFPAVTCSYSLLRNFRDNHTLNNVSSQIYTDFVMLCEFGFGPLS